jgi:hypothetical protein
MESMPTDVKPPTPTDQIQLSDKGKGRKPPPIKKQGKTFKRFEKPVPEPGKFKPLLDFSAIREEQESSSFYLDLEDSFDALISEIATQSQDALVRMNYLSLTTDKVEETLKEMTQLHVAAKLLKTASPAELSLLGPFNSIPTMLKTCPIPSPIVEIIDTIGNFETSDEIWRFDGLAHTAIQLLSKETTSTADTVIRSDIDWLSFTELYPQSMLLEIDVDVADVDLPSLRLPIDFDFSDTPAVDALVAKLDPGDNTGQADEVKGRALLASLLDSRRRPALNDRANFCIAMERTFGVSVAFAELSPSAIKQEVSLKCEKYARMFKEPLRRVWTLSDASSFTDKGSPAQLLAFNSYKTAATGPCCTVPIDFALSASVDLKPTIVSRPSTSWRHTQGTFGPSLRGIILAPSVVTQ